MIKKYDTQPKEHSSSFANDSSSIKNDTLKTILEDKNLSQSESNTLNMIDPFLNV